MRLTNNAGSLLDKTLRYDTENPLFRKLQEVIERPCRSKEWFPLAEQAINTVYNLAERPDIICSSLIKNLTRRVFGRKPSVDAQSQAQSQAKEKDEDAMEEDEDDGDGDKTTQSQAYDDAAKDTGDAFELAQLLFVVGHVAIKQIVFLELVEREWKRQKHEKEIGAYCSAISIELASTVVPAEKIGGAAEAKSKEAEELDQVAGNAEDEIGERIAAMREHELLSGEQSLLARFGPMLVNICGTPGKYKVCVSRGVRRSWIAHPRFFNQNRTLRAAATLAFSKFLCVSSSFCDQNHRLLFRIMEISQDAGIRSNIVIALGDVAVSFSSIIDESNDELYKGLRDDDIVVKKNTLMVLTHLILNGMIKVKGQMGEMAKCVEDEDERIADLAKLFFQELSTKDNAIYNNLPDGAP